MKKFLSVVLATSMLMSMTAISSVQAQTQTSDYTLEFEAEKSWEKMYEADGASGGDYMWVFYDQEADVSSTVSTTIEESGFYYVDVVAANRKTESYLSDMTLTINDATSVKLYSNDLITAASDVSFLARGEHDAKNIQIDRLVYLAAGTNVFNVALAARTESQGAENVGTYAGALDCIKLTKYELETVGENPATIEAENFDWRYSMKRTPAEHAHLENSAASGEALLRASNLGLTSLTIDLGVDVLEAGYYDFEVWAGNSATSSSLSAMKLSVNGGTAVNLSTSNATVGENWIFQWNGTSTTWGTKAFSLNNPIWLEEGVNTISIITSKTSANAINAMLDCIKLTANNSNKVAATGESVIEFEDFYASKSVAGASGDALVWIGVTTDTAERSIAVMAEEEGFYSFDILAANADNATPTVYLSPMTLTINGEESFNIRGTSSASSFKSTELSYAYSGFPVNEFALKQLVYLKKGKNEIKISATEREDVQGGCYGALDCIKLERYPVATIGEDGATVEAEDFDWHYNTAVENSAASGEGCIRMVNGGILERVITVAANAEYAGNYKLNIWAGCEATAPYISKMKVSVNGGDAIDLTGNTTVTPLPDYGTGYNNIFVSDLALNNSVYLNEGINTFDIIITPSAGQENKEQITFVLDCIKLTPSVIKVGDDETKLEFEEATAIANNISVEDNSEASNGLYTLMYYSDPASYSFDLNVQSAGDYALLVAGTIGTALSPLSIKVNDNAPITLDCEGDDKNCELLGEKYTLYNDYMNDLQLGDYLLTEPLSLNEGRNNITVTVSGLGSGSELAVLDYMSLTKLVSYDDLAMDELEVCMVDSVQNIALSNDGVVITNEDVYEITYESSNEDVAVVDGTGAVTAVGMGTATISVAVYPQASTLTPAVVSQKITVVGADGVWVSDMSVSNGDVSFNANALFASNAAEAVVACYDAQSGVLKSVDTVAVPAMSAGASTPLEAELSTYASGDNVSIMLFDSLGNIRPLWVKSNI